MIKTPLQWGVFICHKNYILSILFHSKVDTYLAVLRTYKMNDSQISYEIFSDNTCEDLYKNLLFP